MRMKAFCSRLLRLAIREKEIMATDVGLVSKINKAVITGITHAERWIKQEIDEPNILPML